MSASINHVNPFPPITSLQPQHYHEIAHSFAPRQPAIPSILSNFGTLSVATGVYPSRSFVPLRAGMLSLRQQLSLFVSSTCRLFAPSQKVKSLGIKRMRPLLQNTRVGGGSVMLSSALGTRSGGASILPARSRPALFLLASAKVSQGGV